MKRFIIDQVITLIVLTALIWLDILFSYSFVGTIIAIPIFAYLVWRILLFPIDLIVGKKTEIVYFSKQSGAEFLYCYGFIRNTGVYLWDFYHRNNKLLTLLVPIVVNIKKGEEIDQPCANAKVRITYYKYSKILCNWEPV